MIAKSVLYDYECWRVGKSDMTKMYTPFHIGYLRKLSHHLAKLETYNTHLYKKIKCQSVVIGINGSDGLGTYS